MYTERLSKHTEGFSKHTEELRMFTKRPRTRWCEFLATSVTNLKFFGG